MGIHSEEFCTRTTASEFLDGEKRLLGGAGMYQIVADRLVRPLFEVSSACSCGGCWQPPTSPTSRADGSAGLSVDMTLPVAQRAFGFRAESQHGLELEFADPIGSARDRGIRCLPSGTSSFFDTHCRKLRAECHVPDE